MINMTQYKYILFMDVIIMISEQRREAILELVNTEGSASVIKLSELLDASESTIRRDIIKLDEEKLLKKVHGGAITIETDHRIDVSSTIRSQQNQDSKKVIAEKASLLIKDGNRVYIDAGTTTFEITGFELPKKAVYITNDILIAQSLIKKTLKVYLPGGELKESTMAIVGEECVESISKWNFDIGFFGTNAVSNSNGYTTPDAGEGLIKRKAMLKCRKAYVLADTSKLGKSSAVTFGNLEEAELITEID